MLYDGLQELSLSAFDYCTLTDKTAMKHDGSFNVRLNKLMALIPMGETKTTQAKLNSKILLNDTTCKPNCSATVPTGNSVKLSILDGLSTHAAVKHTPKTSGELAANAISMGYQMVYICINDSLQEMYILK